MNQGHINFSFILVCVFVCIPVVIIRILSGFTSHIIEKMISYIKSASFTRSILWSDELVAVSIKVVSFSIELKGKKTFRQGGHVQ